MQRPDFTPVLHPNVTPLVQAFLGRRWEGGQLTPAPLPIPDPSRIHSVDSVDYRLPFLFYDLEVLNPDLPSLILTFFHPPQRHRNPDRATTAHP